MRSFQELQGEGRLIRWDVSPLGTLYLELGADEAPRYMLRHFDTQLPPAFARPFADMLGATQEWIQRHPNLARWVRVEQPSEVGSDFVKRPYHVYYTSTRSYVRPDDPPQTPSELAEMRRVFREVQAALGDRDDLIRDVLARSLLQPTGKTILERDGGPFLIVEPKFEPEDLHRWVARNSG